MKNPTCMIDDCESPTRSRGWCSKHYQRWYHHGSPMATKAPEFELCRLCGEPNPPATRGLRPHYCSVECRNRAYYLRNADRISAERRAKKAAARTSRACERCGSEFVPAKSNRQIYCSKKCSGAAGRDRVAATCSRLDCDRPVRARDLCANHYTRLRLDLGEITWRDVAGNPETRRRSLRRKTQLRRARMYDANAEVIDRDAIGARDGWKCGLCGGRVDDALAWPHPQSPSLDHIQPLSVGGRHIHANVQIAHLSCNIAKGNRGGGEQLLLIG